MSLDVMVATTVESLTNTAALREILGTTSTAKDSAQANALKRATLWAESYVRRPIRMQVYQEVVPGYGDYYLLLSRRPVRRIMRVFSGTATSAATEYTSTEYSVDIGTGRLYKPEGWPWTVAMGAPPQGGFALDPVQPQPVPFGEIPTFFVEYSAGWVGDEGTTSTVDGTTSTGRTLPQDVELAILGKAGEWLTFGFIGGPIPMMKRVGDLSLSYGRPAGGVLNTSALPEQILDQYRSIV